MVMATHGTLSAFDSSTTNWRSYADQLNYNFIANEITTDKKKVAVLPSACGTENDMQSSGCRHVHTEGYYNDLIQVLSEHYDPAPSSIVQRFKFYNRVREEGESIANYVAALRHSVCKRFYYSKTKMDSWKQQAHFHMLLFCQLEIL